MACKLMLTHTHLHTHTIFGSVFLAHEYCIVKHWIINCVGYLNCIFGEFPALLLLRILFSLLYVVQFSSMARPEWHFTTSAYTLFICLGFFRTKYAFTMQTDVQLHVCNQTKDDEMYTICMKEQQPKIIKF